MFFIDFYFTATDSIDVSTEDIPTKAVFSLADTLLDPERGSSYAPQDSSFNYSTGYPHPLYIYFEGVRAAFAFAHHPVLI